MTTTEKSEINNNNTETPVETTATSAKPTATSTETTATSAEPTATSAETIKTNEVPSTSTTIRPTQSQIIDINSEMSESDPIINSSENTKVNKIIDELGIYSENINQLYSEHKSLKTTFDKLKKIILDNKLPIVYTFLIDNYNLNTDYILNHFYDMKDSHQNIDREHTNLNKLRENIKKVKEQLETKERMYTMNMSEYNKMVSDTNHLKNMLFISVVLLIIPLIYIIGLLTKPLALISFVGFAAAAIVYTMNEIFSDNRSSVFPDKLIFDTSDEINELEKMDDKTPETTNKTE